MTSRRIRTWRFLQTIFSIALAIMVGLDVALRMTSKKEVQFTIDMTASKGQVDETNDHDILTNSGDNYIMSKRNNAIRNQPIMLTSKHQPFIQNSTTTLTASPPSTYSSNVPFDNANNNKAVKDEDSDEYASQQAPLFYTSDNMDNIKYRASQHKAGTKLRTIMKADLPPETMPEWDPTAKEIPVSRFPRALLVGFGKCGTSALLEFLNIHPNIVTLDWEIDYFCDRVYYKYSLHW